MRELLLQGSMGNQFGKCVICGAGPTVKSHLFPRALMFDIRGDQKEVVQGSRHRNGIKNYQSGEWDDSFLCKAHEDLIGGGDDYAISFCRSVERKGESSFRGALSLSPIQSLIASCTLFMERSGAMSPQLGMLWMGLTSGPTPPKFSMR